MRFFRVLKHIALGAAVCCVSFWGGIASAEQTGMEALREAMTMSLEAKDRIFREQVIFFMPEMKADLDLQTVSHKDEELRMKGILSTVSTDREGNTVTGRIPFYLEQSKKDMELYIQQGHGWVKFQAPKISASVVDILGTPTKGDLEEILSLAKDVHVVKETRANRTMVIDVDEKALTELVDRIYKENESEEMTADGRALRDNFIKYLKQGIQRTDVWCTWTVDKRDWQTITLVINLSGVVQETAKAALENVKKSEVSMEKLRLLESMAYYSELKLYLTYLNPDAKSFIQIPDEAKKAKPIDNIIPVRT